MKVNGLLEYISNNVSQVSYEAWFENLKVENTGGYIVIKTNSELTAHIIKVRYMPLINQYFENQGIEVKSIDLQWKEFE